MSMVYTWDQLVEAYNKGHSRGREHATSEFAETTDSAGATTNSEIKQKCGMTSEGSCVHKRGEFCIADMVWFDHCEYRVV